MNYYVFNVADQKVDTAQEVFDTLVAKKSVWGFGPNAANRKAIKPGDRVAFYVAGKDNQYFAGAATLKTGLVEDSAGSDEGLFLEPTTIRIDLENVTVFTERRYRNAITDLEWRPSMGSSSKITEKDYDLIMSGVSQNSDSAKREDETEFVLEKYLEEFIEGNWKQIGFGEPLTYFIDDNGNRGRQYVAGEAGYIDLLAKDAAGNFVVIELKKGRKNDEVVGQILRYITWVEDNLANDKPARGIIIVHDRDKKLELTVRQVSHKVKVLLYKVSFALESY